MTTSDQMTERESMINIYSDFHKEAYGFRPRGVNYDEMTLEDLQRDFDMFSALCEQNEREEAAADNYAIAEFEKRVASIIEMGAGDRKTALRWILDSFDRPDFGYGCEFFVAFELGLGQNDRSKAIAKEIEPLSGEYAYNWLAETYEEVA